MATSELQILHKVDQMNIVPNSNYNELDQEPEGSKETVYESESSKFSKEEKNLVDEKGDFDHNEDMQNDLPR